MLLSLLNYSNSASERSLAEALEKQDLFINSTLALLVYNICRKCSETV